MRFVIDAEIANVLTWDEGGRVAANITRVARVIESESQPECVTSFCSPLP
jgi:hypothetical protein